MEIKNDVQNYNLFYVPNEWRSTSIKILDESQIVSCLTSSEN